MRDHSRKKPDLVSIPFVFGNCAAASVIGSQPSATRNQVVVQFEFTPKIQWQEDCVAESQRFQTAPLPEISAG